MRARARWSAAACRARGCGRVVWRRRKRLLGAAVVLKLRSTCPFSSLPARRCRRGCRAARAGASQPKIASCGREVDRHELRLPLGGAARCRASGGPTPRRARSSRGSSTETWVASRRAGHARRCRAHDGSPARSEGVSLGNSPRPPSPPTKTLLRCCRWEEADAERPASAWCGPGSGPEHPAELGVGRRQVCFSTSAPTRSRASSTSTDLPCGGHLPQR